MPPLTQQQIYELYRSIGTVYSPALREDVRFEGDGLKHIFFKSRKSKRLAADWKRRGGLLDGAVRIVSKIDKVSECRVVVFESKTVTYFALENEAARVIVWQHGQGALKFRSVIPRNRK